MLPEGLGEGTFDVVMTNPPYRRPSGGRVPPDSERALARFELAGGLPDFLRAAAWLLRSGGRCYIVYLAERLAELLDEMRTFRLEPKRLRLVHPRAVEPARLVLVEGRKQRRPGLTVEPPLVVYLPGGGRTYTAEALAALYAAGSTPLS
jgi:tRNA1Val (adenine37-N6)-methyltransferase